MRASISMTPTPSATGRFALPGQMGLIAGEPIKIQNLRRTGVDDPLISHLPNDKILRMSDDLKVSIVARRGIELFHEGQYAEAQQQLESALKLDRNNAWVYYNLGLVYFEQKNWQLALDNFQASLDAMSSKPAWIDTWAHIKRGNAYDARGDRQRAVAEYNKALQSGSNYDNAQAVAKKFINTPFDPKAAAEQAQNAPGDW